jgi:hypothetical protein
MEHDQVALARQHAANFLAPLTVDASVRGVALELITRAQRDPELAKLFFAMQEALGDGRDLLDEKQGEVLDRIQTDDAFNLPSAPNWLRPAILSAYLKASDDITARRAADIVGDPISAFRRGLKVAQSLEAGLIGELIIESTLAAQRSPRFNARLTEAADQLRPTVADLYADEPVAAMARAAGSGSSGSCQACRAGRCEPISCWVIVVIIVIIIVVK